MNKSLLALTVALATTGCSLAPDYERPAMPVTADWIADESVNQPLEWKQQFTDPELQALISKALINNRDLKLAVLSVAEYQAQYNIARDALIPNINANASINRSYNTQGTKQYLTTYTVGGNLSWEIDFFGYIRNQKNAALEGYFAQYENQKAAQISLIASIASAYYTYVADKELLDLYKETLQTEQDSYRLTQNKYDVGAASELELSQSQTAMATAEINVANYERVLKLDYNSLLLLVGSDLPKIDSLKKITNIEVKPISVGSKTNLLDQRPDILAAEHALKAANFNIGVARAALLPRISLGASYGRISFESSNFLSNDNRFWSIGPALAVPMFNMSLYDNLDVVDIQKQKAIISYEKVIQVAFKEVSDALKSFDSLNKQYKSQEELFKATKKYFELAEQRYEQGVDSYLTRLDAQRQYVAARQGLVATKLQQLQTQINLYKAIGGGWDNTQNEQP